ncbi:MAG: autotransporter-associated beta strand repeat-containing protein [Bacteroidota bacterium]
MKKGFIFLGIVFLFVSSNKLNAQNAIVGSGFSTGWGNPCSDATDYKNFTAGAGTSYTSGNITANNTGDQYWRLGVNWSGTFKQLTNTVGSDVSVSPNTKYTLNGTCTSTGALFYNVPSTSYSYIFKTRDAGTSPTGDWVFFQVQSTPITVSAVAKSPTTGQGVNAGQNVTVTATLSATLPTGQGVYLRYADLTTGSYGTVGVVLAMSGSGTTYTATIPSAANIASHNISYYVFTSGNGLTIANSDADLFTINFNNNSSSNYTYTVGASTTTYTYISVQTGNWNTASTWVGGVVPPLAANVQIVSTHNVTIAAALSGSQSGNVTVDNTATLTMNPTGTTTVNLNGTNTINGFYVHSTGVLASTASGSTTFNGLVTLNASITIVPFSQYVNYGANSTLQLNGIGNTFIGNFVWLAGASTGVSVPVAVRASVSNANVLPLGTRTCTGLFTVDAGITCGMGTAGINLTVGGLASGGAGTSLPSQANTLTIGTANTNTSFDGPIGTTGVAMNLIKTGTGTLTLSGANIYTGTTTINNGTLTLGAANVLPITTSAGVIQFTGTSSTLNTGNFNLGSSTATANSAGQLDFDVNTTINLGSTNSVYFKASSGQAWSATAIAIYNWTGTAGATGTGPHIYVGSATTSLTTAQLAKITFNGYAAGAMLLATGELVPVAYSTYYWIGGTTATNWNIAGVWSTTLGGASAGAITPNAYCIFIFNGSNIGGGATGIITARGSSSTMNVGQIILQSNATVIINPNSATTAININGGPGTDLDIPTGCTLTFSNTNSTINLLSGTTGAVAGTGILNLGSNNDIALKVADANGLIFSGTAQCNAQMSSSSFDPFGASGTNYAIVFQTGTKLTLIKGDDPFGGAAFTQVVFNTGSTYELQDATASQHNFDGRTFADFIYNASTTSAGNFGSAGLSFDNITVLQKTFNIHETGTLNHIKGNVTVATGATIKFNPASSSTFLFDGATTQTLTLQGTGIWTYGACSSNQNFTVTNTVGVVLASTIPMATGTFQINSGGILDAGLFSITALANTCTGSDFKLLTGGTLITKNTLGFTTAAGGMTDGSTVQTKTRSYAIDANYKYNNTTTAQAAGNGLTGAATLTIDNGSTTGVTMSTSFSVTTVLQLTKGQLITGSNTVTIPSGSSVSTTGTNNNWVNGNLKKYIGTSTSANTFEVGGSTYYTPAVITFTGTSGTGSLTVNSADGDHANISTSTINSSLSANRNWTLTNSSIVFTNYSAVFNYNAADLDPYTSPTSFEVALYNAGWTNPTYGTRTSTSLQATANTTFGAFQLGERCGVSTKSVWVGTTNTEWNTASNWSCNAIPTSTSNVIIPNVTNKPLISTAHAVANSVTIAASSILTMSGIYNLTISSNGYIVNNAGASGFVASASTGAVIFSGGTTSSITGTTTLQNVTIGGGIDFGTAATLNGTFTINSGGYVANVHPPIYACTSTLKYNSGTTYNRGSEWISGAITGQPGYPGNVLVSTNVTNTYFNFGNAAASICGSLTVNTGNTFDMGTATNNALTIGDSVHVMGTLELSTGLGGDLYVAGNYRVGSSGSVLNYDRSTTFNGTIADQLVTKTGGGTVYFDYLKINKTSGNLKLSNTAGNLTNIQINSSTNDNTLYRLQLLNGNIDLNDQTFTYNGTVENSTNIYTSGTGVRKIMTSTGTGNFDITGTASSGAQNLNVSRASALSSLTFDNNVTLSTTVGVDFGLSGMTLINSYFYINTNGFVINNSPDYGNSSYLVYNNGSGGFKRNVEWNTNTPGLGYPNNIIVQNNTPLTLNVTHLAPGALGCSGFIDIQSGSSMDMGTMPYSLNAGTNLTIGGTLTLSTVAGGDLNVGGSWTRTGTFTQNSRNVTFNGSTDGTLTATGGQLFSYVYLNKSAQVNKLTLADHVSVSDEIGFTRGTVDMGANNKFLTILSTATKTARVAQSSLANTAFVYGSGHNGQFIVQRYVPAKRAWRLVSPPISGANASISQAWQEGQAKDYATSGTPAGDTVSNGFATQITGGTTTNGFDLSPQNNASIKYYSGGIWQNPANTNSTSVKLEQGWMLFVRGDRKNFGQITNQFKTPTITTLRPRGEIFIGQKRFPSSGTLSGKQVIGNPYASAIDFHTAYEATKADNGGTLPYADQYYMWDPNLGGSLGVGAFVTYIWNNGTSTYDRTSMYSPINIDDRYIPSGAAFMVDFGPGSYLLLNETDKNSATTTKAYRPSRNIRTNLVSTETNGNTYITDGVLNLFDNSFNNAIDENDAKKIVNIEGESFSTKRGDTLLSIERKKLLHANDTIFYNWSKVKIKEYQLEISTDSLQKSWMDLYLEDNYKKTKTPVSLFDTTRYKFNIILSDSGTFRANRFRLIMNYNPPVFSNIKAVEQFGDVAVQWQIANEKFIDHYIIERSADGTNFESAGNVKNLAAAGASIYQWLDTRVKPGNNFYKVYGLGADGEVIYSDIVKIKINEPAINVTPNPATDGNINLKLTTMPKGTYGIILQNNLGQVFMQKQFEHAGGSANVSIISLKTKGMYHLKLIKPDRSVSTIKVLY